MRPALVPELAPANAPVIAPERQEELKEEIAAQQSRGRGQQRQDLQREDEGQKACDAGCLICRHGGVSRFTRAGQAMGPVEAAGENPGGEGQSEREQDEQSAEGGDVCVRVTL